MRLFKNREIQVAIKVRCKILFKSIEIQVAIKMRCKTYKNKIHSKL